MSFLSFILRGEDFITSGSLAQDIGFTAVLDIWAHGRYATVFLALLWSQKTSQNPEVIIFSLLNYRCLDYSAALHNHTFESA